ncbi:MAG TPA: hypothetical protein VG893_01415, partial [Terracidiphilus sp.]|nr:hypothetical protein [Terracidiphilus sp.]
MMRSKHFPEPSRLAFAAALLALSAAAAVAQSTPSTAPASTKAASTPPAAPVQIPARAHAYYHDALAAIYEDEAVNTGQPEYVSQAIDQYKNALDADPNSAQLNDA